MNDLGNLLQAVQRAVLSTPTLLYSEDPGFTWPTDLRGNPQVYFALPHMLLSVFGHSGKCNVAWRTT